jgi:hypothetical protein
MPFDQLFFLMQREGYITRSCVCTAFNELLAAQIDEKGRYYIAFFQLAIGIERTEKLAIILDHMIENELKPPGSLAIRKFGHDLGKLYDSAKNIAQTRSRTKSISFELVPLHARMLRFLADFANGARYANLDALASGDSYKEPLVEWRAITREIFDRQLPEGEKAHLRRQAADLSSFMEGRAVVMAHDLATEPLSVESMIALELEMKANAPYVLWHLLNLIRPLTDLVSGLSAEARRIAAKEGMKEMVIPHMDEFYEYLCLDQNDVLSRECS